MRAAMRSCALRSVVGALLCICPVASVAEEGVTGHYVPGTISSLMDGVSPSEVLIVRLNGLYYDGGVKGDIEIPIGGQTAVGATVKTAAVGLTAFWRPAWGELSEKWGYAMSATIPFVHVEVEVSAEGTTLEPKSEKSGLGDIVLMPLMFNYHLNDDININSRLAIYAPTGDYEVGRLANLGKNYWTFEPIVAFMYLGQENGREASIFFGADFNTKNPDTNYQTGSQIHIDGTLAQHLPIGKGLAGIGVTGFWYEQVEGDSGSGAILGSFKARTTGVGPSLTYSRKIGNHNLVAELKWVHEVGVRRRPEGDSFILKAMLTF